MDRIWRHLHTPFELCPRARGLHECQWQVFDADRAGCTRCSYVHVCNRGDCNLIQTEESMVCDITGYCVVTKNFVLGQYSDCIAYQGSTTTCETSRVSLDEIERIVRHLLMSASAVECRRLNMQKFQARLSACIQSAVFEGQQCAIRIVEASLSAVGQRIDVPLTLPTAIMLLLVDVCAKEICRLVSVGYFRMGIQVRPSDFRDIVVGLLFLMRTGIVAHGVVVLRRVPLLMHLLPVENMLCKMFQIQSKTVTDVENKYKMHIRQCTREALLAVGFDATTQKHAASSPPDAHHTVLACLLSLQSSGGCS